jgi:Histidine kinase/Concanavalin A-like lectin/glucanases superfamily
MILTRTYLYSQPTPILSYTFDSHGILEDHHKLAIKPVSISLADDRFGNPQSAVMLQGHHNSYLNLGTSPILKPINGSISLWAKLDYRVYAGKGVDFNPIIVTKRCEGDDFYNAYTLVYSSAIKRIVINTGMDTAIQPTVIANDTMKWGQWYHYVFTWDQNYIALYVNGLLQNKAQTGYEMTYLASDSVVLGISANPKNYRCMGGEVDDIFFYDHVLTGEEVLTLYQAPNPNRLRGILADVAKYAGVAAVFILLIILLVIRNRRQLKRQQETYELQSKISELEIKVIKSQMNPHFLSNSLAAIQNLIYTNQVDLAGLYIAKFSLLLRQVLYMSQKNFVPLAEELEIVRLNIELEQLRFADQFDFVLEVDAALDGDEVMIPALLTQPFIENAIWHGLLPLAGQRRPKLTISAYMRDNYLHIDIADNGVGRQPKPSISGRVSMGMQLSTDKVTSLNKLMNSEYAKIEIVDLYSPDGAAIGTCIKIMIDSHQHI